MNIKVITGTNATTFETAVKTFISNPDIVVHGMQYSGNATSFSVMITYTGTITE